MKRRKFFFLVPVAAVFLFSWIVMLLWNGIVTEITTFKAVTYWQAAGLLVLCKILFGFRGPGPRGGFGKRREFADRMRNLSADDREKLRSWCNRRKENFENREETVK